MLIVPISRSLDWRHPPLLTLLLILVNTLIFFGLQSGDEKRAESAYRYYVASALPRIELPRYVKYLEASGRAREAAEAASALNSRRWPRVLAGMEADGDFMRQLRAGQIVVPSDAGYTEWRRQRDEFDQLKRSNARLADRFGFKPAAPTLSGLFGHMFLHGSFDHLLGNMAILFIVGCLVEKTLGWRRYLCFYLLSGLGAAAFDWAFNGARMVPGIGASGAISGVMAMFVALYGLRRIRFFYWAFVYFDFFTAPAIIVLPFWMLNELYQYFFNHGSPVNYMAHFGGLVTGAALIAALRFFGRQKVVAPRNDAPADPLPEQLARVDAQLGALRIDEALQSLRRLARKHPQDLAVLNRYYKVSRNRPAGDDYHRAAALIFALSEGYPGSDGLIHETFVEYLKLAQPTVRFSARQLVTLTRRLARAGYVDDAERLTRVLARRAPEAGDLPGLLLLVAEAYRKTGNAAMRDTLISRLHAHYPDSDEARAARLIAG